MASAAPVIGQANLCCTEGCNQVASMRCPICIQLKLPDSHFCTQECYKALFSKHKLLHNGDFDFSRAFSRGSRNYTKQWWTKLRANFLAYWEVMFQQKKDMSLMQAACSICQHVCA
jgi:hypothetical protein